MRLLTKTELPRVTRIDRLTPAQEARMPEWRDKWIDIGLRTGAADRPAFEWHVANCYRAAGLEAPKRVVWVQSPMVLAFAAPAAALALEWRKIAAQDPKVLEFLSHVSMGQSSQVEDAVRDAVGGAVRDAVRDAVEGAVEGAVEDAVRDAVGGAVRDAVGGAVRDAVEGAVRDAVEGAVRGAVRGAVGDAVRDAVGGAVGGAVGDAVRDAVGGAVRGAVRGAVGDAVEGAVEGAVRGAVEGAVEGAVRGDNIVRQTVVAAIQRLWTNRFGGQFWVGGYWWGSPSFVSFFREVCGLDLGADMNARALAYAGTAESACWWWPHKEFVMVCERPVHIDRDAAGRLHSENRLAIQWPDGWGVAMWHGMQVPEDVILHPERITVARIDAETNAELRRVMIECFGMKRYVREAGADVVHEDLDSLGLPRRLLRRRMGGDLPDMMLVDLINSSPEPEGTSGDEYFMTDVIDRRKRERLGLDLALVKKRAHKRYLLCVDAQLRPMPQDAPYGTPQKLTCHNAVASTFGLRGEEYRPQMET